VVSTLGYSSRQRYVELSVASRSASARSAPSLIRGPSTSLRSQLSKTGFDRVVDSVERAITHKSDRFAEPDAERTEVEAGWRHALEFHSRQIGLRQALEAAERAWHEHGDEEAQARIYDLQRQLALSGATGSDPSGSGS